MSKGKHVISRGVNYIKRYLRYAIGSAKTKGRTKYFCIGQNKTGTTSLQKAFKQLGFVVGEQVIAEQLMEKHYFSGNFQPLIKYCRSAQVFQDLPFSRIELLPHLDQAYPNSRFILTERDSPEQWYESLVRFHSKLFGQNGNIPTGEDLLKVDYIAPGFAAKAVLLNGTTLDDPYHKPTLIQKYIAHNKTVKTYFHERPEDLLVINLAQPEAYRKFTTFLDVTSPYESFPWENKT